jgi:hypothetical protein
MVSYAQQQQQQQQQQAIFMGAYGGGMGVEFSHAPSSSQAFECSTQYPAGYGTVSTFGAGGDYQQQQYGEGSNALQGLIQQQAQQQQQQQQQQELQDLLQQQQPLGMHMVEMGLEGGAGGGGWGVGGVMQMPLPQGNAGGVYVDDGLMGYDPQQG